MSQKNLEYYFKLDYKIISEFIEDEEDGNYWTAKYDLLNGCKTDGNTKGEAIQNVRELFEEYIIARLEVGQDIPEPEFIRLPTPVQEIWIAEEPIIVERVIIDDTLTTESEKQISETPFISLTA